MHAGYRPATLLDLRLGHVQLTPEEEAVIRQRVVPVLAGVVDRTMQARGAAAKAGRGRRSDAARQAAAGKQATAE